MRAREPRDKTPSRGINLSAAIAHEGPGRAGELGLVGPQGPGGTCLWGIIMKAPRRILHPPICTGQGCGWGRCLTRCRESVNSSHSRSDPESHAHPGHQPQPHLQPVTAALGSSGETLRPPLHGSTKHSLFHNVGCGCNNVLCSLSPISSLRPTLLTYDPSLPAVGQITRLYFHRDREGQRARSSPPVSQSFLLIPVLASVREDNGKFDGLRG